MKISALNIPYQNTRNAQSFQGLWGKTESPLRDIDETLGVYIASVTEYYFPFKDESEEEINREMKAHISENIDEIEGQLIYTKKECHKCATLPFTKEDFYRYYTTTGNTELTEKLKLIHSYARDKYINTNSDNNGQKSAKNEQIERKLS